MLIRLQKNIIYLIVAKFTMIQYLIILYFMRYFTKIQYMIIYVEIWLPKIYQGGFLYVTEYDF